MEAILVLLLAITQEGRSFISWFLPRTSRIGADNTAQHIVMFCHWLASHLKGLWPQINNTVILSFVSHFTHHIEQVPLIRFKFVQKARINFSINDHRPDFRNNMMLM